MLPGKQKAVKKKKTAIDPNSLIPPPPRDLTLGPTLDGLFGSLGLGHTSLVDRATENRDEIISWKIEESLEQGEFDLDFTGFELDEMPDTIFRLPWLTVLNISKNRFTNSLFSELSGLVRLRSLIADENLFVGTVPASIGSIGFKSAFDDGEVEHDAGDAPRSEGISPSIIANFQYGKSHLTRESTGEVVVPPISTAFPPDDKLGSHSSVPGTGAALDSPGEDPLATSHPTPSDKIEVTGIAGSRIFYNTHEMAFGPEEGLYELSLSRCLLTGVNEQLSRHKNMQWLNLSYNHIPTLPANLFQGWHTLKYLDLSNNKLGSTPDFTFPDLSPCLALEEIVLSNNQLFVFPESIALCPALKILRINNNKLTSLPESLGDCVFLEELDLTQNAITEIPGEILRQLQKLRILYIACNQLTSIPAEIAYCQSLEVISFSSNLLNATAFEHSHQSFGYLTELREAYFDLNSGLIELPKGSVYWSNIEVISARFCKIKSLPENFHMAWRKLKFIDVRGKVGKSFKDICKVLETHRAVLPPRCRVVGFVNVKPKASKKKKAAKVTKKGAIGTTNLSDTGPLEEEQEEAPLFPPLPPLPGMYKTDVASTPLFSRGGIAFSTVHVATTGISTISFPTVPFTPVTSIHSPIPLLSSMKTAKEEVQA